MTLAQRFVLAIICAGSFAFATLFGFLSLDWLVFDNQPAGIGLVSIAGLFLMGQICLNSAEAVFFDR